MAAKHWFDETWNPAQDLTAPLHWKKPRWVRVEGDLFHEDTPFSFIDRAFVVMALAAQHTFVIMTDRLERTERYLTVVKPESGASDWRRQLYFASGRDERLSDGCRFVWPLPNVIPAARVHNQAEADERIPQLLRIPAARRAVIVTAGERISLEPQWSDDKVFAPLGEERHIDCGGCLGTPVHPAHPGGLSPYCPGHEAGGIDWVIVESPLGPDAPPVHPQHIRDLRDQCQAAGVPMWFEGFGVWHPLLCNSGKSHGRCIEVRAFPDGQHMMRVGRRAGRMLDGQEICERPAS